MDSCSFIPFFVLACVSLSSEQLATIFAVGFLPEVLFYFGVVLFRDGLEQYFKEICSHSKILSVHLTLKVLIFTCDCANMLLSFLWILESLLDVKRYFAY